MIFKLLCGFLYVPISNFLFLLVWFISDIVFFFQLNLMFINYRDVKFSVEICKFVWHISLSLLPLYDSIWNSLSVNAKWLLPALFLYCYIIVWALLPMTMNSKAVEWYNQQFYVSIFMLNFLNSPKTCGIIFLLIT